MKFGESRWRIVCGKEVQRLAIPAIDISECGVADTDGVLQHGFKYRLKVAGGACDHL